MVRQRLLMFIQIIIDGVYCCLYTKQVNYEFDPTKNESNFDKHGLWLSDAEDFEWDAAVVGADTRKSYPEPRFQATGYISERLCVMVFCFRADVVRVISLRKANPREVKSYAET